MLTLSLFMLLYIEIAQSPERMWPSPPCASPFWAFAFKIGPFEAPKDKLDLIKLGSSLMHDLKMR
jgi:hypothetical protein